MKFCKILFICLIVFASTLQAEVIKEGTSISSLDDCIIITPKSLIQKWKYVSIKSLNAITFPCAFVPEGYTFDNAPVVMYVQAVKKEKNDSLEKHVQNDFQGHSEIADFPSLKNDSSHISKLFTPHNKNKDPYLVVYADHEKHFLHLILSGRSLDLLKTNQDVLKKLEHTIKYAYYVSSKEEGNDFVYLYETDQKEKVNFAISKSTVKKVEERNKTDIIK